MQELFYAKTGRISPKMGGYGTIWCNPPYGREIWKWVQKACKESENGETVVMLLPARTDTRWFHDFIIGKAEIRFVKGRLKFGSSRNSAPFPSIVVIFRRERQMKAKIMESACDICRWPFECAGEEALMKKCETCPVEATIDEIVELMDCKDRIEIRGTAGDLSRVLESIAPPTYPVQVIRNLTPGEHWFMRDEIGIRLTIKEDA